MAINHISMYSYCITRQLRKICSLLNLILLSWQLKKWCFPCTFGAWYHRSYIEWILPRWGVQIRNVIRVTMNYVRLQSKVRNTIVSHQTSPYQSWNTKIMVTCQQWQNSTKTWVSWKILEFGRINLYKKEKNGSIRVGWRSFRRTGVHQSRLHQMKPTLTKQN